MRRFGNKKEIFKEVGKKIEGIMSSSSEIEEKLYKICDVLKDSISYYDWVGIYFVDQIKRNELILGPYVGETTEHVRICFGSGICGQAAERKETFLVQDVSKETNYLSCSEKVQSEIVVPVFKGNDIVGEIDIDSHSLSPFSDEDKNFLENLSARISKLL